MYTHLSVIFLKICNCKIPKFVHFCEMVLTTSNPSPKVKYFSQLAAGPLVVFASVSSNQICSATAAPVSNKQNPPANKSLSFQKFLKM